MAAPELADAIRTFHVYPSEEMQGYCQAERGTSVAEDPHFLYAAMRDVPIVRSERYGGFWIFSTYEDVRFVYKNPEIFSSYPNPIPAEWGSVRRMIPVESDAPQHTHYRHLMAPLFGPVQMDAHEARIREVANELVDRFIDSGRCEFIADFARVLPASVFVEMMGWPSDDALMLLEWSDNLMSPKGTDEEIAQLRAVTGMKVYSYFAELIDDRKANPGDDILSQMVMAKYNDERPLTQFELLDTLFILLSAGLDTTKSVLGNGILALAKHPHLQKELADHPDRIPLAIEEIMRFDSPTIAGRRVTRDYEYRGVQLSEGDRVMIITGSADRDATVFDEPDEFQIDRFPNRHLGFGAGAHRCLGSHIARLELRVALEVIHRRMAPFAIDPDEVVEPFFGWLRGVDRLPLVFGAEAEGLV